MKRLTFAAAAAALMLAVAPQLHAQAAQQGQKDTTKKAATAKAKPAAAKSAPTAAASKSASTKTASSKSRKAKKAGKAKTDTTAKKSEE